MNLTCPVCRAINETGLACRRCKADLSLLWGIERQRSAAFAEVLTAVRERDWLTARQWAIQTDALRSDDESRRLCAMLALLTRDFEAAWRRDG